MLQLLDNHVVYFGKMCGCNINVFFPDGLSWSFKSLQLSLEMEKAPKLAIGQPRIRKKVNQGCEGFCKLSNKI